VCLGCSGLSGSRTVPKWERAYAGAALSGSVSLSGITLSGSGTAPKWERRHSGVQAAALGHDAAVVAEERSLCAPPPPPLASTRMLARDLARSSAYVRLPACGAPTAAGRAQVRARAAAPADRRAPHAARRAGERALARVCVRACEHSPRRTSERWLRCAGRADGVGPTRRTTWSSCGRARWS
jgi:hypothetical protein